MWEFEPQAIVLVEGNDGPGSPTITDDDVVNLMLAAIGSESNVSSHVRKSTSPERISFMTPVTNRMQHGGDGNVQEVTEAQLSGSSSSTADVSVVDAVVQELEADTLMEESTDWSMLAGDVGGAVEFQVFQHPSWIDEPPSEMQPVSLIVVNTNSPGTRSKPLVRVQGCRPRLSIYGSPELKKIGRSMVKSFLFKAQAYIMAGAVVRQNAPGACAAAFRNIMTSEPGVSFGEAETALLESLKEESGLGILASLRAVTHIAGVINSTDLILKSLLVDYKNDYDVLRAARMSPAIIINQRSRYDRCIPSPYINNVQSLILTNHVVASAAPVDSIVELETPRQLFSRILDGPAYYTRGMSELKPLFVLMIMVFQTQESPMLKEVTTYRMGSENLMDVPDDVSLASWIECNFAHGRTLETLEFSFMYPIFDMTENFCRRFERLPDRFQIDNRSMYPGMLAASMIATSPSIAPEVANNFEDRLESVSVPTEGLRSIRLIRPTSYVDSEDYHMLVKEGSGDSVSLMPSESMVDAPPTSLYYGHYPLLGRYTVSKMIMALENFRSMLDSGLTLDDLTPTLNSEIERFGNYAIVGSNCCFYTVPLSENSRIVGVGDITSLIRNLVVDDRTICVFNVAQKRKNIVKEIYQQHRSQKLHALTYVLPAAIKPHVAVGLLNGLFRNCQSDIPMFIDKVNAILLNPSHVNHNLWFVLVRLLMLGSINLILGQSLVLLRPC